MAGKFTGELQIWLYMIFYLFVSLSSISGIFKFILSLIQSSNSQQFSQIKNMLILCCRPPHLENQPPEYTKKNCVTATVLSQFKEGRLSSPTIQPHSIFYSKFGSKQVSSIYDFNCLNCILMAPQLITIQNWFSSSYSRFY